MTPPDTTGTEQAISDIAQSVASIRPYARAVEAITLGPQDLYLDGQSVGSWDPFGGSPDVEGALRNAQQHCFDFQIYVMDALAYYPTYLAATVGTGGGSGIVHDLAPITAVMAALAGGATPTAAQRQTVNSALADIIQRVNGFQTTLAEVQTHATTFQSGFSADIQALDGNAQTSVATAISSLQAACENAITQYSLGPGGSAVVAILEQITAQMNTDLASIRTNLAAALASQDAVTPALGRLQNLFTGMLGEYTSLASEVRQASDDQFCIYLQQSDFGTVQKYWQDTAAYAAAHGFGVPHA